MADEEEMTQEVSDVIMTFKDRIEGALQIFANMAPTQRAESIILWNIVSDKLQGILNRSVDAMNEVSIIVVRNNNMDATVDEITGSSMELAEPVTAEIIARALPSEASESQVPECDTMEVVLKTTNPSTITDENNGSSTSKEVGCNPTFECNNGSTISNLELHSMDEDSTRSNCSKILLTLGKNRKRKSISSAFASENTKKIDLVVEKNRWSCNSCEKQFDDYILLQNHIQCDHSVSKFKPIKCNLCDAILSTKSNYTVHLRKHSGERPFSCAKCSVTFTTSNNLRRHMLSHQGVKPYRCSICDSRFTEKRSLQIHHRTHTGERPYRCTQCDCSFRQKSVLKSHMVTHSQEKPFVCAKCGQSFKKKNLLRSHEARHSGEKKYECHYCKSAFVTKSDLNRHEQSHRAEKRFACQEENCGMSFMRKQSLREHMNRHQGIKPYKCVKCTKSYPQLSEFRKHCKKHSEEV